MNEVQRIVDSLAQSTKRAVAIHDPKGRILAYSSHEGPVDEVRRASILTRQTVAGSLAWSRSQGIEQAEGPMRIPANPDLGMDPRICAPVRYEGKLLAFLWLVDADQSLPESSFDVIRSAADASALAIHGDQLLEAIERGHERELLRDLFADDAAQRGHAADELVERDLFTPGPALAFVLRPVRGRAPMTRDDSAPRQALKRALGQARLVVPRRQGLELVRLDHALFVLSVEPKRGDEPIDRVAAALHKALAEALVEAPGWRAVVGVGDVQPELTELRHSYQHARQAAEAAGLLESFDAVTRWSDLGVYQTLLAMPLDQLTNSSLHPGLIRLLELRDGDVWLQTLETYFDLGCDARAAAVTLSVQRGTLYHRLHRIEELAQVDLSKGDDRLALHLGLKLIRLAGITPSPLS